MITVRTGELMGPVRALNGVNLGPLDRYWTRDYSEHYRAAGIPWVRTHDASLFVPDVGELHHIFADVTADPDDPRSYRFGPTDAYLDAVRRCGARVDFRIGEAIDHGPTRHWIRPERWTPELMSTVVTNIARHYNDGWADGHHWDIGRWTFWEEPDGANLWTGSPERFGDFYSAVARSLKAHDPGLRVGLAAFTVGFVRHVLDGGDRPGWEDVLPRCVAEGVPVDFVSWNCYGSSWREPAELGRRMRAHLDAIGLAAAENHIAEWNHNPQLTDADGSFTFMSSRITGAYRRVAAASEVMTGPVGAAAVFATMTALQDAPVDVAHLYLGTLEPWGLFDHHGGPNRKYDAFAEFGRLVGRPRVAVEHDTAAAVLATEHTGELTVAVSHDEPLAPTPLVIAGESHRCTGVRRLDRDGWQELGPGAASPLTSEAGGIVVATFEHVNAIT